MTRHVLVIITLLMLTVGLASACGGGNGADDGESPTGAILNRTESPAPTVDGAESTPTGFEALRDALRDRLDTIGVNIAAVPDDVRDQILASCRELEAFVERDRIERACEAIEQAIEGGDPGLIDLVLEQLAELEPD